MNSSFSQAQHCALDPRLQAFMRHQYSAALLWKWADAFDKDAFYNRGPAAFAKKHSKFMACLKACDYNIDLLWETSLKARAHKPRILSKITPELLAFARRQENPQQPIKRRKRNAVLACRV